jgi:hypothetical protein
MADEDGGFWSDVKEVGTEAWEGTEKVMGANTVARAVYGAATGGKELLTEGAEAVAAPIEAIMSGAEIGYGGAEIADGAIKGDGLEAANGVHDLASGGFGAGALLGGLPGIAGKAGFTLGDKVIAPAVFGSMEADNEPHYEDIPEDGVYKPSTGNQYVDGALDFLGVR